MTNVISRQQAQDHTLQLFEQAQVDKNSSCPACRERAKIITQAAETLMQWLDTLEGEVPEFYIFILLGHVDIFDEQKMEVIYSRE
jgi:hypothetical protein